MDTVNTQVFLIVAGYVHRKNTAELSKLAQSSLYLNAISNRLAASSSRASLLGMIVGSAISELVDPKEKRMNFGLEEVNNAEGQWYKSLTRLEDYIGSTSDMKPIPSFAKGSIPKIPQTKAAVGNISQTSMQPASNSKIISIEELNDKSSSDEEDIPIHEKPDSDASDSEDDPTLIQRNRPVAPVYVSESTSTMLLCWILFADNI